MRTRCSSTRRPRRRPLNPDHDPGAFPDLQVAAAEQQRIIRLLRRARRWALVPGVRGVYRQLERELERVRAGHLRGRSERLDAGEAPRIAVACWSLSQNPAGRAVTLVDIYRRLSDDVELIGWINERWGDELWSPLQNLGVPVRAIRLGRRSRGFVRKAVEFVAAHPYDVVHLSKPRLHTVLLGKLYELFWGAHVIMDVDDEELGFVGAEEPQSLESAVARHGGRLPQPKVPHNRFWTQVAVGQVASFPHVTVSNPALQQRYGGTVIPHVRDETEFVPSAERTAAARDTWDIPWDAHVVLFFGTPRRHKGLMETAKAVAELGRDDVWYVIAGDFPDKDLELKHQLEQFEGLHCRFIPGQPYRSIPDVVAMGDYIVLLQDESSLAAQYQLPAKLIDALAMGLISFCAPTRGTQWLIDDGVVIPVTPQDLNAKLASLVADLERASGTRERNREYFVEKLSVAAAEPQLREICGISQVSPPDLAGRTRSLLRGGLDETLRD